MIDEKILIEEIESLRMRIGNNNSKEIKLYEKEYKKSILKIIEEQPKVNEWIPVEERLPKEHDSIFAKLKGTNEWNKAMFEKTSDDVNVTIEFDDGVRKTKTMHTRDGEWSIRNTFKRFKVIAWQPLPEPYVKE